MAANQLVGKEIGEYILEDRIGRGATADVYRARQKTVKRYVAIKVINPIYNIDDQEDFRQRFEHEAKIIAALEHIHVLPVHDYGVTSDGTAYIVMRLMRGGSLEDLIAKECLSIERAARLFNQIASALHYAHERSIIHRDIKPSNILMDEIGNAYLSDFGVAKFTDHPSLSLTKTGYIIGAPAYSSPEQLRDLPIDRRSDVYSMGVLLYTMLVGHTPYAKISEGVLDVINKQINMPPPPPRSLRSDIPAGVEGVVMAALNKNPDDRFPTVQAMSEALNAAVSGQDSAVALPKANSNPHKQSSVSEPTASDRSLIRLYALGIVAVIVGIAALFVLSQVLGAGDFAALPAPTILDNQRGVLADVVPSDREIRLAQGRMGESNFVAYVTCSLGSQTQATRAREMDEYLAAYGIEFQVYDATLDRMKQVSLINQAVQDGAKALIICPLDDQVIRESVLRARRGGVPVVFTALVAQDYNAVMIEQDNHLIGLQVGREAGNYINEALGGQANVVVIGDSQLASGTALMDAMGEGVLESAPDAQIVGTYDAGADRDAGYETMQRILRDTPDFDVVLSLSDATSFGLINALEEVGVAPTDVSIFSVNGESLAQQYVRDGYFMRATLHIAPEEIARISVDATIRLLGDGTLPEYILLSQGTLLTQDMLEVSPQG